MLGEFQLVRRILFPQFQMLKANLFDGDDDIDTSKITRRFNATYTYLPGMIWAVKVYRKIV